MERLSGIVNVADKTPTQRIAKARGIVVMGEDIIAKIKNKEIPKGDVLEIARVAAIMAVKKTEELIPHCHNIFIEHSQIDFQLNADNVVIETTVETFGKTGVEMEAMSACCIAALTIYDVCKMFSKSIEISEIYLLEKRGGKSGDYRRETR